MQAVRRVTTAVLAVWVLGFWSVLNAWALPDDRPDGGYGVNGPVRAVLQVGDVVWVGGRFTQVVRNDTGAAVNTSQEVNLAAFDLAGNPLNIGQDLGGDRSIVHDLDYEPTIDRLYVAGRFTVNTGVGTARNLIALDGVGNIGKLYSTPPLFSVMHDGNEVLAGSKDTLWNVFNSTSETALITIATIGGTVERPRVPQIVDIEPDGRGGAFLACKCDRALVLRPGYEWQDVKAFFRVRGFERNIDASWSPVTNPGSLAFGWEVLNGGNGITYLSAGGSDFVQAVNTVSGMMDTPGTWKTNVNGQAQTSIVNGSHLVVGGHWRLVGSDDYCQPRLMALDLADGSLVKSWHPAPNPSYPGVWALESVGGSVWAGGEFSKVAHDWRRTSSGGCVYKVTNGVPNPAQPLPLTPPNPKHTNLGVFA